MSIITPVEVTVASREERTWRATIETPKGAPYSLSLHREQRNLDAEGGQVGDTIILPPIVLQFDNIKDETVTLGGTTLTVEQITGFLVTYFDQKAATQPE